MKVTVGQITDRGLNPRRTHNEDNLLALPERGLFLVADGVGGRQGGEVASRTVVEVFTRVFNQPRDERDLREVLADTIEFCNQKVFADAQANEELDGMATTLALVAVEGTRAIIAHVGDSRVYRYDEQGLIALTQDHSEVNEAVRAGVLTPEQAARHPRRNVISRAIGADPEVEVDFREIEIDEFTSFLLCTDGITLHVSNDEITRLLRSGQPPQAICERLKELCYEGGAEDNLTAIVVDFGVRAGVGSAEDPTLDPADAITLQRPRANTNGAPAKVEFSLRPSATAEEELVAEPPPKQTAQLKPPSGVSLSLEARPAQAEQAATTASAAHASQPPTVARGAQQTSAPRPARRAVISNLSDRELALPDALEEGEWPLAMKMSLLIIALGVGVVAGLLIGRYLRGGGDVLLSNSSTAKTPAPPSDPEVGAAYARFLEGKPNDARSQLNTAIAADPRNAEAHYYLGLIEYTGGRYEDAITHLNEAAKLDPNLADVRIRLAMAYISIGQARTAKDVLQQAVAPPPKPNTAATPTASPTPAG